MWKHSRLSSRELTQPKHRLIRQLASRAGLNEREAPGKAVTAGPTKRLAQLRSGSHALVSTWKKHRWKTSKLIRFGSLHFRDHWAWPCTSVRMWLICSNRKLYHNHKTDLFATVTLHSNLFCRRLSGHLHCTNRCVDVGCINSRIICPSSLLTGCTHGCPRGEQNGHFPWKLGLRIKNF